jgi:hypothetical protein
MWTVTKYDPLRDFLDGQRAEVVEVRMTFGEVAELVGPLPESATKHRAWWANDSKVQAQAWRTAGWRVNSVDQGAGWVVFSRDHAGVTESRSPRLTRSTRPRVNSIWRVIAHQPLVVQVVGGVIAGVLVLIVGVWLQARP